MGDCLFIGQYSPFPPQSGRLQAVDFSPVIGLNVLKGGCVYTPTGSIRALTGAHSITGVGAPRTPLSHPARHNYDHCVHTIRVLYCWFYSYCYHYLRVPSSLLISPRFSMAVMLINPLLSQPVQLVHLVLGPGFRGKLHFKPCDEAGFNEINRILRILSMDSLNRLELVVSKALRNSFPEFLLANSHSLSYAKFVAQRQDPDRLDVFRIASG